MILKDFFPIDHVLIVPSPLGEATDRLAKRHAEGWARKKEVQEGEAFCGEEGKGFSYADILKWNVWGDPNEGVARDHKKTSWRACVEGYLQKRAIVLDKLRVSGFEREPKRLAGLGLARATGFYLAQGCRLIWFITALPSHASGGVPYKRVQGVFGR